MGFTVLQRAGQCLLTSFRDLSTYYIRYTFLLWEVPVALRFRDVKSFLGTSILHRCWLVSIPLSQRSLNPIPVCSGEETHLFPSPELQENLLHGLWSDITHAWSICSVREGNNFTFVWNVASAALALESAHLACLHSNFPEMCCVFSSLKAETAL